MRLQGPLTKREQRITLELNQMDVDRADYLRTLVRVERFLGFAQNALGEGRSVDAYIEEMLVMVGRVTP